MRAVNKYSAVSSLVFPQSVYFLKYDKSTNELRFKSLGGVSSHGDFWKHFMFYCLDLRDAIVKNNYPNSEKFYDQLINLLKVLQFSGANHGGWLSSFRNDSNYLYKLDHWYPSKKMNTSEFNSITASLQKWRQGSERIDTCSSLGNELKTFILTCQFIVSLCMESAVELDRICGEGKNFNQFKTLKYLKSVSAI